MAVIDCLEDPDETLKLKTLELLVTMTKANNVQVGFVGFWWLLGKGRPYREGFVVLRPSSSKPWSCWSQSLITMANNVQVGFNLDFVRPVCHQ